METDTDIMIKSPSNEKCAKCYYYMSQYGCDTCEISLCCNCWNDVHSIGTLKTHKQIPINEFINISKKCKLHPHYNLDLVCICNDCDNIFEPICILCEKSKQHKGHITDLLDKVAEDKRKCLNTKLKNINDDCNTIIESINSCSDNIKTIDQIKNYQINKINEIIDKLHLTLDILRRKSITSVNKVISQQVNDINSHKNQLDKLSTEFREKRYNIENLLKISNELAFMIEFAKNSSITADEFVCGVEYDFNGENLTKQIDDMNFEKSICNGFVDNCAVIKQLLEEKESDIIKLKDENDILQNEWQDSIVENDRLNYKFTEELNNEFIEHRRELSDIKNELNDITEKNHELFESVNKINREKDMLEKNYKDGLKRMVLKI